MVHFAEISQAPLSYSMLQDGGRVATPKFVPGNCLRYLQTTLKMGVGALVSEFMGRIKEGEVRKKVYGCVWREMVFSTCMTFWSNYIIVKTY